MSRIVHKNRLLQEPFTQMFNFILDEKQLSNNAKLLYTHLKKFAWGKGSAFPGKEYLAELMNMSSRQVFTYIKELEASGLVEVHQRGMGETNLYVVTDEFSPHWRKDNPKLEYKARKKELKENDDDDSEPAENKSPVKKEEVARETNFRKIFGKQLDAQQLEAIEFYQAESRDLGSINGMVVGNMVKEYGVEWFIQAYSLMRQSGKEPNHLKYVEGILKKCRAENHSPLESIKKTDVKLKTGDSLFNYRSELMRKAEAQKEELGY